MKKLFSLLSRLLRPSDNFVLRVEMTPRLKEEWDRLKESSGLPDDRHMMASMVGMAEWSVRKLEEGRIIVAMDPAEKTYIQLDATTLFPNYKKTSLQDLGEDE